MTLPEHDDPLLDQFLEQCELAHDPLAVLKRSRENHPELAEQFTALAETRRLLARVRPESEPPLPAHLGDFRIVRKIGWGGMGDVYEAVQEPFGRRVAVKTIRPIHVSKSVRERFSREQQVLADLHQTHIVPIFAAGRVGETHYFAMPYLPGVTLQDIIREGGKASLGGPHGSAAYFHGAAALLADAAEAVAYVHERGILHRDLKPGNLMVDDNGHIWILDFGLAGYLAGEGGTPISTVGTGESVSTSSDLTTPGLLPGTLDYMAPEQLDGSANTRTDVWGLGMVLYELLTLRRAFASQEPLEGQEPVVGKRGRDRRREELSKGLTPLRQVVGQVPRDLEAICLKCLEVEPGARYPSAHALAEDLRRFRQGEETFARHWNPAEHLWRWCRRNPTRVKVSVLTAMLLAVAVLAGYTLQLRTHNVRNAEKLAGAVAVQFDLVKQAVSITARQEKLRRLFGREKIDSDKQREHLRGFLSETQKDFTQWFAQSGQEPLVNLLVFDPEGTLLADSLINFPSEGKNYADRDYIRGVLHDPDRRAVYVSQVYVSFQDNKYKLAVITRIWDGDRCIGLLAATIPISSRLVVLDMKDEPAGAGLACPIDWTYPDRHAVPADERHEYVYVLHPGYRTPSQNPKWVGGNTLGTFSPDIERSHTADYFALDACITDYVRIGETQFVVIVKQPYSWPIVFQIGLCLALMIVASWSVAARVKRWRDPRLST